MLSTFSKTSGSRTAEVWEPKAGDASTTNSHGFKAITKHYKFKEPNSLRHKPHADQTEASHRPQGKQSQKWATEHRASTHRIELYIEGV